MTEPQPMKPLGPEWKADAASICDLITGALADKAWAAADAMYESLLYATQDYLKDNVLANIGETIRAANAQAAHDREALRKQTLVTAELRLFLIAAASLLDDYASGRETDRVNTFALVGKARAAIHRATQSDGGRSE